MANSEAAKLDKGFPWLGFTWRGMRYGVEHSLIETPEDGKYLERWIIYFAGWSLRLHKFWRGDDERAPHDHPFDFWTMPLRGYWEKVPYARHQTVNGQHWWDYVTRWVAPFRFHYRPATFRHIVLGNSLDAPFYTICIARYVGRRWGFWPNADTFIYWRDFK